MQNLSSIPAALKKHATRIVPAGAVMGVLAASLLMAPAAIIGLGTGYNYGGPNCTSATLTAAPAQPQLVGTAVTLTGTATACTNPEFRFFVMPPGGLWTPATASFQTWPNNTFVWSTTGAAPGVWGIGVWARHSGSTASKEVYALGTFQLGGNCTSASLSAAPASPQAKGVGITLTASSTGCPSPQYKFFVMIKGVWTAFGPFSSSPTKIWGTASYRFKKGANQLAVLARQATSTRRYDTYAIITFQLT